MPFSLPFLSLPFLFQLCVYTHKNAKILDFIYLLTCWIDLEFLMNKQIIFFFFFYSSSMKKRKKEVHCMLAFNPFSTRPHVWCNNSCLGFLKILNYMYVSKEKNINCKKWALICQLNVAMVHRNYFRQNNLWILKLATYTKIEDQFSRCKLATF